MATLFHILPSLTGATMAAAGDLLVETSTEADKEELIPAA
jgi:hypothetical protein